MKAVALVVLLTTFGLTYAVKPSLTAAAVPIAGPQQQDASPASAASQTAHTKRRSIAVIPISLLSDESRRAILSYNDESDASVCARSEAAITRTGAFRLVSRDLWLERLKEIKRSEDGLIDSENLKQLGKDIGVDFFLIAYVPREGINVSRHDLTPAEYDAKRGLTVANFIAHAMTSKKGEKIDAIECHAKVVFRFTNVETGERETKEFSCDWMDHANKLSDQDAASSALNDIFAQFSRAISSDRVLLEANVVQVKDDYIRIDQGSDQGVTQDSLFEVYEMHDEGGGYIDPKRVGDKNLYARVKLLKNSDATLELGSFRKKKFNVAKDTMRELTHAFESKVTLKVKEVKEKP